MPQPRDRIPSEMPRTAYCVVADENYFPAAVYVATAVRAQVAGTADVLVLTPSREMMRHAPGYAGRVGFEWVDLERLVPRGVYVSQHVSAAAYLKLVVPESLAGRYERLVVLDADLVIQDARVARLPSLDLRGHALAAVLDVSFFIAEGGADAPARDYRARLGLPSPFTPYFNSGVMVIDTARWLEEGIGRRALEFAGAHPERCRFYDQSALNATLAGQWLPLSPSWNFVASFESAWLERLIRPVILHFAGPVKHWHDLRFRGAARHTQALQRFLDTSPWPEFIRRQRRVADLGRYLAYRALRAVGRGQTRELLPDPKKVEYLFSAPFADLAQGLLEPFLGAERVAHPAALPEPGEREP